jgi:putative acetyltransferase
MPSYVIRRYLPGDEQALARVMRAAIEGIGPRGYSPQQVIAWAGRAHSAQRYVERAAQGDRVILALDHHGEPAAYSVLEPCGHVDHLYCAPDHAGNGLGKRLLAEVDIIARELRLPRLYTEASELARPVFANCGYSVLERRDFAIDGVPIHNFAMEKTM